jgi:hypothetical protein
MTLNGSGSITLSANLMGTGGVTIGSGEEITLSGSARTISSTNSAISIAGTIDGAQDLIINAGTNTVSLTGIVGGSTQLSDLDITAATTTLGANVNLAAGSSMAISGNLKISDHVTIDTNPNTSGSSTSGSVTIVGSLSAEGTGLTLSIDTSLTSGTGGNISIGAVSDTGGTLISTVALNADGSTGNKGSITLNGDVSTAGAFSLTGGLLYIPNGGTLGASQISINAALSLPGHDITLSTSTANGDISLSGGSGGSASVLNINSGTGAVTMGGDNYLGLGNVTVTAGSFNNTVNIHSAQFVLNNSGAATIGGNISGQTGIVFNGAGAVNLGANLSASNGSISTGAMTLTGTSQTRTLTAEGASSDISIGAITGAGNALVLSATRAISMTGAASGLSSFTATSSTLTGRGITTTGNINLSGVTTSTLSGIYTTSSGSISLNNLSVGVSLSPSATLTAGGSGNISITGETDSTAGMISAFNVSAGGTVTLGAMGKTRPLGATSIAGASVVLNGDIILGDVTVNTLTVTGPVTLNEDIAINTDNVDNDGDITFSGTGSTINGAKSLNVTAGSGAVRLQGIIGGSTPLTGLTVSGGSLQVPAITVSAGNITLDGTDIQAGALTTTVSGNIDLTAGSSGFVAHGNIISGGNVELTNQGSGSLGLVTAAGTLTLNGTGDLYLSGNLTGTGGIVVLTSSVHLTGSSTQTFSTTDQDMTFGGEINGAQALILNAGAGRVTLSDVGNSTRLTDLDITAAQLELYKDINLAAGSSFTTSGNTLVLADVTIDTNPGTTGTSGSVTFGGWLNGKNPGTDLVINTSASGGSGGTISLGTVDSSGNYLQTLTLNSSGSTNGAITLTGDITTTGAITVTGPVMLGGGSAGSTRTLTTTNSNVTFQGDSSTINGARALTIDAGTGTITLSGAVGNSTALSSLSLTGATVVGTGGVTATGSISFDGTLTLSGTFIANDILTTADIALGGVTVLKADTVTLGGAVTGSSRLTILPKTSGTNMTLNTSGGTLNYGSTTFSGFTGDLWLGALYNATTAVSGNLTFTSALTSAGNIYAIAGQGIQIEGAVSSTSGNVTMVAVSGNIVGSGTGTHMSGSAIQLGALNYLGSSTQTLNVTGSSVQAWQGQNPMYVGYSGTINNTIGSTVLQFIPSASGSNTVSNPSYNEAAMQVYAETATQAKSNPGSGFFETMALCPSGSDSGLNSSVVCSTDKTGQRVCYIQANFNGSEGQC